MTFEEVACSACGDQGGRIVCRGEDRLHGGPGRFAVVRCERCGLMRTSPRPSRADMRRYYPADYQPYLQSAVSPGKVRELTRRLLAGDDTPVPVGPPGRLLEIGAASGNFLLEMQKKGWSVTGLEWDGQAAARAAARTGADVLAADLAAASFAPGTFDLICGWMVFEHLEDPRRALDQCWGWLKPGGWLAFSVPDCGSWQFRCFRGNWHALQLPTHLHHFTAPLLRQWLTALGFEPPRVRWQATLVDVPVSLALALESRLGASVGRPARALAWSLPVRLLSRALGRPAAALRLTGRLTVWARKPC